MKGFKKMALLHPSDRPREKLKTRGSEALNLTELLAILIGTGIKGMDVLELAENLLRRFGAKGLPSLSFEALSTQKGIGVARASVLLAAIELGKRLFCKEEDDIMPIVDGPESVYGLTRDLSKHKKEHFVALYLNAKNRVLKQETISIGSLFATIVHPREVFAPALSVNAAAVVLAHNHPSGDPEPSPEDKALTRRLAEAGKLMGVEVLDHLVIGKKGYVSFREKNWL
jgi:DNA repair protein RadC